MFGELKLRPLRFHETLADTLEALEPGLWRWFSSNSYGQKYADTVKIELLRSTYRLPRESNETLYAIGNEIARAFAIDAPLTLYQAQEDGALNAGLVFVPSETHVVLRGPVLQTLSEAELRALFGHELAHHKLWTERSGRFRTAESMIEHTASHARSAPSHVQTALRQRRWTEIFADRGSLIACEDLSAAIGCLVKMATGLRQVDANAYLAQAEETIGANAGPSAGTTHPEAFIRAFALKSWAAGEDDPLLRALIEGPLDVEALDLLQQRELLLATQHLLNVVLAPHWMRTDATLAHARRFFPDFDVGEAPANFRMPSSGDSVDEYVAYVLLDFGMVDTEIEEAALARVAHLARELGIATVFAKIARKEVRMSAANYAELERRGAALSTRNELPHGDALLEAST